MKVLELTVKNVRGLPDLRLQLDGKSLVIWGPNGAGKSCVVDAIEFLLTGSISRLKGEGTAGITLAQHGPHIDHDPKSAYVKAIIELNGFPEPVEISRSMDKHDNLVCPEAAREAISKISDLVVSGGIVLTRRDILRFVAAEAGKRADEIESLLNLGDVDNVRSALVRARTELQRRDKSARDAIETARADVNVTLGLPQYSDKGLLEHVNDARARLGGDPIDDPSSSRLKHGVLPPANATGGPSSSNPKLIQQATDNLRRRYEQLDGSDLASANDSLRTSLEQLRAKPELLVELEQLELTERAVRVVDDSTVICPVCGASWPEGQLKRHLEERIDVANEAQAIRDQVRKSSDAIATPTRELLANLSALLEGVSTVPVAAEQESRKALEDWKARLTELHTALGEPREKYFDGGFSSEAVSRLCAPDSLDAVLSGVEKAVGEAFPEPSAEQTAWDKLTQLEVSVRALEHRTREKDKATLFAERSRILLAEYESARDAVLADLYSRIADRFTEFYCLLHDHEGDHFGATLSPEGAKLSFMVDFMGRGSHPPHALHSEGHQDSMGICLFLALNEELAKDNLSLIVFDDVVMSVDAGHRKEICGLLNDKFPQCQFIITTHDRTWAKQLKHEGVVEPSRVTEFTGWTVDSGPQTHQQMDMWAAIQEDLDSEDVSGAAFKLRRGSEEFFEGVCDALGAEVVYNSTLQWQLDDWLPPAMAQYKELLRRARGAARSWGHTDAVEDFDELESVRKQVSAGTHVEQWAVNATVHYNSWADMSKEDFGPVVEAFKDLHQLFLCSACGGLLQLVPRKGSSQVVKCRCGRVNWNLSHKQ